jgi:hypothetical protein
MNLLHQRIGGHEGISKLLRHSILTYGKIPLSKYAKPAPPIGRPKQPCYLRPPQPFKRKAGCHDRRHCEAARTKLKVNLTIDFPYEGDRHATTRLLLLAQDNRRAEIASPGYNPRDLLVVWLNAWPQVAVLIDGRDGPRFSLHIRKIEVLRKIAQNDITMRAGHRQESAYIGIAVVCNVAL